MATTFLEPGGDSTFNVANTTSGGLWDGGIAGVPAVATDFVHGSHIKSIKFRPGQFDVVGTDTITDTGTRISMYIYLVSLPTGAAANTEIFEIDTAGGAASIFQIVVKKTTGILRVYKSDGITQLGSDGPALATGTWYRISVAYTITSTTINRIEVFVNGIPAISITNAILANTGSGELDIGNLATDVGLDFRISDIYIDNSSALTDPGNIWVTAKRPFSNGTTNGFTTQIGAGGSGYGSGHSSQVNERPLSTTNGWSMIGAGSAVTEEYNIETKQTGDISIPNRIVDYVGWVSVKSLASETIQIILNGVNFSQAITSTITVYTKIAGSSTYPTGTGTDIGITTDTTATTVSLYECGIIVAYIPATIGPFPTHFRGI